MPIVNGAYVAPTWNNDAPPAINAAELQDICDTIETYDTSKANVSYVNTFVRPNLLDNAYFVGGGSQQGGGQFPINQRRQTTYSSNDSYSIDRWKIFSRGSTGLEVQSDGIALSPNSSSSYTTGPFFAQLMENPSDLYGKTVTFSALLSCPSGTSGKIQICSTNFNNIKSANFSSGSQLVTVTTTSLPTNFVGVAVVMNKSNSSALKIVAMKLEIGDTQTLARQENGVWVLNEIPDFKQELGKCQRYCYVADWDATRFTRMFGATTGTSVAQLTFPTPVTMRTLPTVSSAIKIAIYCQGVQYDTTTYVVMAISEGSVTIRVTALDSGSFPGSFIPCIGLFNSGTLIVLSADL